MTRHRILLPCLAVLALSAITARASEAEGAPGKKADPADKESRSEEGEKQTVQTQEPEEDEEAGQRHTGFFIRLAGGPGYVNSSAKNDPDALRFAGLSSNVVFSIGGAVMENLIISTDFIGVSCSHDKLIIDDTKVTGNYDSTIGALGLGISYYFMPLNMYVGGTLGVAAMEIVYPSAEIRESKAGWAVALSVGKEWWFSAEWGIGVALHLAYFDTPRKALELDMATYTGGALLTVTYN